LGRSIDIWTTIISWKIVKKKASVHPMHFDGGSSARILPLESRHTTYIIPIIKGRGVKKSRGPKEGTTGSQGECGFAWQMQRGRRASPISIILSCCFFIRASRVSKCRIKIHEVDRSFFYHITTVQKLIIPYNIFSLIAKPTGVAFIQRKWATALMFSTESCNFPLIITSSWPQHSR
jgi:hypothetical protein